jgi:hypothetical protein
MTNTLAYLSGVLLTNRSKTFYNPGTRIDWEELKDELVRVCEEVVILGEE